MSKPNMDALREGSIVNTEQKNIISKSNEQVAVLGYGVPVVQGLKDDTCRRTTDGDTKIIGITVRERSGTTDGWKKFQSARIMESGLVAVKVIADVKAGDEVHIYEQAGYFSNANGITVPNAFYTTSAKSGELAVLRLK